jgi:hypothetical protein
MSDEVWLPVVGYEGSYEVSSLGRVRSIDRTVTFRDGRHKFCPGTELRQKINRGYRIVGLTKASFTKTWCVHRLVCEAFHGPKPSPDSVIRHLNGDRFYNQPQNLTWGTPAENTADMIRHGNAYWSNRTRCKYGHEFTPENTRMDVSSRGGQLRNCRKCLRSRSRSEKARRRQKRLIERPVHRCDVCGSAFQTAYRQARFCSPACKKASRRVQFIHKEVTA